MFKYLALATLLVGAVSCTSKESVKNLLKENPDILVDAIQANPEKIMTALSDASRKAQAAMQKNQADEEAKSLEESFNKPLQPVIGADQIFKGPKDAPLTLVIYSDFECPYCSRGFKNENELVDKYKGKMRVIFKNLPLPMHPHAMISAQYYEAIRLQSPEKAEKFHNEIFSNQQKLQGGETYLKSAAKDVHADLAQLAKDVNSDKVKARISADMEEANKFGFQGTPGYILNGVPVRGAYPVSYFEEIIGKLKEKGKVSL